ncbi:NUDIX hydrolase [Rhodopila globiformis]|uniref:Nudix hydrolase domain-containing protein n=1 Tax=Rhodopila globiformis TaxID=1071 RepID=A0A2S6MZU4_RHOGL|nr:NUDIX hydrolase [Rhodopila globiformis]PPQ27869.1 hypothetical protein CCS01_26015 [Rhodopila globiformis]
MPITGARPPTFVDTVWQLVYRCIFPLARTWWRLSGARHEGALVAVHVGDAVLLVRASYRSAWSFPGGGIRRGETPAAAARRELIEELGLTGGHLTPVGTACGRWDGLRDRVHFFDLRLDQLPPLQPDNREIVAVRLVPAADLRGLPLTAPVIAYLDGSVSPDHRCGCHDRASGGAGA